MRTTTPKKKRVTPATPPRRTVPKEWKKVVGILKGRKADLTRHVRRTRAEWN